MDQIGAYKTKYIFIFFPYGGILGGGTWEELE